MFDAGVGSTHLINATAAEALSVVEGSPGLSADAFFARLQHDIETATARLLEEGGASS